MDREEALRLLREGDEGVREWNRLRSGGEAVPSLARVELREANLEGADLREVELLGADLAEANLRGAHLEGAVLRSATLRRCALRVAHLGRADLRNADLERADLRVAHVEGANLNAADLRGADIRGLEHDSATSVSALLGDADTLAANPEFARHVHLQRFEDSARAGPWLLDVIFRITLDYGRQPWRWPLLSMLIALLFGVLFSDWLPTGWRLFSFEFANPYGHWYAPFYFSFVTFTTLGFGDVVPVNVPAQLAVTLEVIVGYTMLGVLVAILGSALRW